MTKMTKPPHTASEGAPTQVWTLEEIYREALIKIARMQPSEIVPGIVHGPQLLLDNCKRFARDALKGKRNDPQ